MRLQTSACVIIRLPYALIVSVQVFLPVLVCLVLVLSANVEGAKKNKQGGDASASKGKEAANDGTPASKRARSTAVDGVCDCCVRCLLIFV